METQSGAGQKMKELVEQHGQDYHKIAEQYALYLVAETNAVMAEENLTLYDPVAMTDLVKERLAQSEVDLGEKTNDIIDIILAAEFDYAQSIGIVHFLEEE